MGHSGDPEEGFDDLVEIAAVIARALDGDMEDSLYLALEVLGYLMNPRAADADVVAFLRGLERDGEAPAAFLLQRYRERKTTGMLQGAQTPSPENLDANKLQHYKTRLARRLRKLRRIAGFSVIDAASRARLTPQEVQISESRRSVHVPSASQVARLLQAYKVSPEDAATSKQLSEHIWPFGEDVPEEVRRALEEELGVNPPDGSVPPKIRK